MTRANLYDMAQRIGLYADQPDLSAGQIIGDMKTRIEFIGFEPDPTTKPGDPGATIIGVTFLAPTPPLATKGANELVSLILQENTRMRTDRASDTLDFFKGEVERLTGEIQAQSKKIADFKTAEHRRAARQPGFAPRPAGARPAAAPRPRPRGGLAEEPALLDRLGVRAHRPRRRTSPLSPEEEELQNLQSQLLQQQAIYKPTSPQIRVLQTRIAALQQLVEQAAGRPGGARGRRHRHRGQAALRARRRARPDRPAPRRHRRGARPADQADGRSRRRPAGDAEERDGAERPRAAVASLQTQYTNAVNSLGQAQVGEKIEVMSKGQRFTLIEAPFDQQRAGQPAAAADLRRRR